MQLEKVTSRSGPAALAGWISSNDVTLFTTVLVMAIAVYLHTRITHGAKEKVQINQEKAMLAARLDATEGELDASKNVMAHMQTTVNLTRDERDQYQQQLVRKLDEIADLNARLDTLLDEKGQLESQHRTLIAATENLSKEKSELLEQNAALADEREALNTENVNLQTRLEEIAGQLTVKISTLEQVELQRDRLQKLADELDTIVAGLRRRLEKLNNEITETRTTAASAHAQAQARVQELQTQLAARDKTVEDYLIKLDRATTSLEDLAAEKNQLRQALSENELKRQAELLEEGSNYRKLIGLTGRLERVAVLFDASGSMRQATNGRGDRWAEAQEIAAKWLQHLNVRQCVLIVFSSTVHTFPDDGTLADVSGESGKDKRESLLQQLRTVSPGGWTNTYDALRKAYHYDIDAILLFSDGAPSSAISGAFNPAAADQIYKLCRTHPNIPIHTIGLGNYFDQNASTFLISIAKITKGTFRGQ